MHLVFAKAQREQNTNKYMSGRKNGRSKTRRPKKSIYNSQLSAERSFINYAFAFNYIVQHDERTNKVDTENNEKLIAKQNPN